MNKEEYVNAKIMVVKDIHSGTKITISGNFIILHDTLSHCQFTLKNGEIVSGASSYTITLPLALPVFVSFIS